MVIENYPDRAEKYSRLISRIYSEFGRSGLNRLLNVIEAVMEIDIKTKENEQPTVEQD